jgi:probable addiction module antidote protein
MTKTIAFGAAKYLSDSKDQAELLNDAFESGKAACIANALGVIARARDMSIVARGAGVTREALYKALSNTGDPELTTFMSVLSTLDFGWRSCRRVPPGAERRGRLAGRRR